MGYECEYIPGSAFFSYIAGFWLLCEYVLATTVFLTSMKKKLELELTRNSPIVVGSSMLKGAAVGAVTKRINTSKGQSEHH